MANRIKSDGPTKRIKAHVESLGATAFYIKGRSGSGCGGEPDLCVGFNGRNHLWEVKADKGKLSDKQKLFHSNWRGMNIAIVRNEVDADIALGLVP